LASARQARALYFLAMASVVRTDLGNGLPLFRVGIEGTRAVTIAVAFAAGSRVERPEEHGIAHFLEHLVFKGGQDYPTYREVNAASERLGARTNAFTSTDYTARPRLDPGELDKERRVVLQEIARMHDQPSSLADELIGQATFGEHPLGRSILGTPESLRSLGRDQVLDFRSRCWAGAQGGVFLVGDPVALAEVAGVEELFERYPRVSPSEPPQAAPDPESRVLVEQRDSKQSHMRLSYRPDIDVSDPAQRAALTIFATLLGGSAGSRLFDEIREQRGLAYSVRADDYTVADSALLELSAGLDSSRAVEAYQRMREIVAEIAADGPTEEEVERARSFATGRRIISFESTIAVAREAIDQHVVFDCSVDPDEMIARLDAVSFDRVKEVARSVAGDPAVACVGPHRTVDFA
jgi:predicted Zn-dependent peptidase